MDCCTWIIVISVVAVIFWFKRKSQEEALKKSLKGKVVLVTGSANGLGKSICLALAREKCHIICVDIDETGNADTVEKVKQISKDSKVESFKCDITDYDEMKVLGEKVYKIFDKVDILINNAGIMYTKRFLDTPVEIIRKTTDINLHSHFWALRTFLPKMIEKDDGHIVAICSAVGKVGLECLVPYCASKFAVTGLMESLQHELMQMNTSIKTLTVYPGFMGTTLLPKCIIKPGFYWISNKIPVHVMDTNDVANAIICGIKTEQRSLYYPHYNIIIINIFNILVPQCITDFIMTKLVKMYPVLWPEEKLKYY